MKYQLAIITPLILSDRYISSSFVEQKDITLHIGRQNPFYFINKFQSVKMRKIYILAPGDFEAYTTDTKTGCFFKTISPQ